MELKEFLKKYSDFKKFEDEYIENQSLSDMDYGRAIDMKFFPEALQNFADQLCQKQRENCANKIRQMVSNAIETKSSFTDAKVWITTYDAEQPKIEEL